MGDFVFQIGTRIPPEGFCAIRAISCSLGLRPMVFSCLLYRLALTASTSKKQIC